MNGSYRGINFNRARMAPQQVPVAGGTMRPQIVSAPAMREAIMQTQTPQSVAEILSEGLPEMMPNLGGATSTADRKREIADMLTQRAMGRNATSIGTGLAQLGEAFIARGATKRADEAETARRQVEQDLLATATGGGPDAMAAQAQIEGMLGAPQALAAFKAQRAAEAENQRYMEERDYERGRDTIADTRYQDETAYVRGRDVIGDQRYETEQERAARLEAEDKRRFGLTYGLEERRTRATENEANQPTVPEFGDTWKMREGFEKRAQTFEESQRQYYTMQDLAKDGTGASDVALGFAFFKTIDPSSTVREGEFAQAASSMGLGATAVQMFARLDKGEKFSPELRQELLQAAGRAYDQQAMDIQGLYERESQFASSFGVDPALVARNPVRQVAPIGGVPPMIARPNARVGPSGQPVPEGFE